VNEYISKTVNQEKTLCAYVFMHLCSYVLMHIQVISTKEYVRNFQQKMQNEPNSKVRNQNTVAWPSLTGNTEGRKKYV
jgi:hypothetical protein